MCQVTLLLLLVVPAVAEPTSDAEINRLVRQLGDECYAKREAATSALRLLGEKALVSLRAAKDSPDPEVRGRVSDLLGPLEAKVRSREIEAIKKSKLTPLEKGKRLSKYIIRGMSESEVNRILGSGADESYHRLGDIEGRFVDYKEFGLTIVFQRRSSDKEYRVANGE